MFFPEAAPFVDTIQQSQGAQQTEQVEQRELTPEEKEMGEFVSTVFADTEDIWTKIFEENNLGSKNIFNIYQQNIKIIENRRVSYTYSLF